MLIIGADACKDRLVYCVLDSEAMPQDINEYYLDGANFHSAYTSAQGLKQILDLQPDAIAIEPTGVNYTRLWVRKLNDAGVKVALIGHSQLKSYRKNLGLPDKDDPADALALGYYFAEHHTSPRRFVLLRDETTGQLRERALRLGHLARLQSPMLNRLQQDLAYAFPEKANATINAPLFWRWIAGQANSLKYDQMMKDSIGSGITADMRAEAKLLCLVIAEEARVELELRRLLEDPQFLPYRKVLKRYGMGERTQAFLISQIFPLTNFLDDNQEPIVMVTKGKRSGKPTAKKISLRRFCKIIGVAPVREQSGKSPTSTKKAGSQLCRNALWLWSFTRIENGRARLRGDLGQELYEQFVELKDKNPIKLARSKSIAKTVNRIFYELVESVAKLD
jgi:transposase